ncbi:MAG: hypothetical protein RIA63_11835, partial [Cyclobacteriaceae bacterium]
SRFNGRTINISHGIARHFIDLSQSEDIEKLSLINESKIKIGYVGNLSFKYLDKPKLIELVRVNPQFDFYFIGPFGKSNLNPHHKDDQFINMLSNYNNVFLQGEVASTNLPSLLRLFDILLLCYNDSKPIEVANPHKILEYLSTGKPIVSHYIDEYKNYADLIYMSDTIKDIVQVLDEVAKNLSYFSSSELNFRRQQLAAKNTYENKIELISGILGKYNL